MRYLLLTIGMLPTLALAQSEPSLEAPLEPISSPYLMKLTGGLILVVLAIFVFAWLVKKLNLNPHSQNGLIRIIAGLSIGTRDRIVLLQIGDEQILVGLTPGRIEKLHTLAQPLEIGETSPVGHSFADKLSRLMNERKSS